MYNYSLENKSNNDLYLLELLVDNNKFVKFIENKMDKITFKIKNNNINNIVIKLTDIIKIKEYSDQCNINDNIGKIINKNFFIKFTINKNNINVFYFIN